MMAALAGQAGISNFADLLVAAHGTPNMSVDVAAGSAFIAGTEATFQGSYYFLNDAVVNLVVAAADVTNPRHDLVVARIRDTAYSGANDDAALVVVTGTPAGSPVDPATPADSLVLARVQVNANASSIVAGNITDLRAKGSAPDRYAGQQATAGPPTTGAFVVGQYVFDLNGILWTCTAAGTPGTWKIVGAAGKIAGRRHGVATTSIGNLLTIIALDTSDLDPFAMGVSNGFTVPYTGIWHVSAGLEIVSASGGGQIRLAVGINGSSVHNLQDVVNLAANSGLTGSTHIQVTAGQTINVMGISPGGAIGFTGWLSVHFLG
jgi:hypothetical protein